MTTLAQRIKVTPMAPYMTLLQRMTREQKQIVVSFITESILLSLFEWTHSTRTRMGQTCNSWLMNA